MSKNKTAYNEGQYNAKHGLGSISPKWNLANGYLEFVRGFNDYPKYYF